MLRIHFLVSSQEAESELLKALIEELREERHEVEIFADHNRLPKGDIMFILGYLRIVPKEVLKLHSNNLVIHGSALPHGKGWSPVPWQILEGADRIPFTLFEANEDLDAGQIYFQKDLVLSGVEIFHEWKHKQWLLTYEMVREFLRKFPDLSPVPQIGEGTFYRRRKTDDDEIRLDKTLEEVFNQIRICDPDRFPAWFEINARRFKLRIEPFE